MEIGSFLNKPANFWKKPCNPAGNTLRWNNMYLEKFWFVSDQTKILGNAGVCSGWWCSRVEPLKSPRVNGALGN